MPVTIENKTGNRVLVRFNSGQTRHLAPHEVLKDVEHVEVKGNAHIQRLQARHVLGVASSAATSEAATVAKGKDKQTPRSTDMKAEEAIDHIRNMSLEELRHFVPPEEDRATVLRAMDEKRGV